MPHQPVANVDVLEVHRNLLRIQNVVRFARLQENPPLGTQAVESPANFVISNQNERFT